MRLIFGMVLGALLTVGVAFVADSLSAPASGTGASSGEQRPMVNWDVVGKNLQELKVHLREQWAKLAAR
jgi:hypothetical protein